MSRPETLIGELAHHGTFRCMANGMGSGRVLGEDCWLMDTDIRPVPLPRELRANWPVTLGKVLTPLGLGFLFCETRKFPPGTSLISKNRPRKSQLWGDFRHF